MSFRAKPWQQYPNTTTPETAAALIAMETRSANYTGAANIGAGVRNPLTDYVIAQTTIPSMLLNVGTPGVIQGVYIPWDSAGSTELYESTSATQQTVAIATADPTNPRIDRVIASVPVSGPSSMDTQVPTISVLTGTPNAGATLANQLGSQALPTGSTALATVLVANGATSIAAAAIQDERGVSVPGTSGLVSGPLDYLTPYLHPGLVPSTSVAVTTASSGNQYACQVYVPRRITFTRFRWRYAQGATAGVGNYNLALYSAAGRQLAATGSQAWAGAASTIQTRAETTPSTTIEAGVYYFWIGATMSAGQVSFVGPTFGVTLGTGTGVGQPGVALISGSGSGTTAPVLFTGAMADLNTQTSAFAFSGVPLWSLASA